MNGYFYSVLVFLCLGLVRCGDQLIKEVQELRTGQKEIKNLILEVFLELNKTGPGTSLPLVTTKRPIPPIDLDLIKSKLQGFERKLEDIDARNTELTAKYNSLLVTHKTGVTFVRWGRKGCPGNNTELVYSGFAGGSWYEHSGAAAEFVCLPRDPDLTKKFTSNYAFMYGAEYDTNEYASGAGSADDLPCSVCRSTIDSSVLMIPGKSSCYDGWSLQYHGDLISGAYSHKAATQYICLDENPETLTAGKHNYNGKLFYPVKAVCGALACPPYQNDKYLTCVVCTK